MLTRTKTLKRARSLRREMTLPEILLWQRIRGRKLDGLHFRHQQPMGPYILDFYCARAKLAIEIDGAEAHAQPGRRTHDTRRDAWLRGQGVHVVRFTAADVLNDKGIEGVLQTIVEAASPSTIGAR